MKSGRTERNRADPAEEELSEFSYIVSHDLARSFRHMAQFSELLLEDLGGSLSASQQGFADQIKMTARRCHAMMEQLLVYSRIQQKPLALKPCDATLLAETALLQLSGEVREAGAEVGIEPLGTVTADEELLLAAIKHLLGNGLKFRSADRRCRVSIRAVVTPEQWAIHIIDNGIGVLVPQREKAFGMFQQLQPEGTYPGVGAGLAICRRIARRHRGEAAFLDCLEGTHAALFLPQ